VIYTLHLKPSLSVVELAGEIGYTHPSTIVLLKDLEKLKLIRSTKDKSDERKRLLQLTTKGRALIEQMKPVRQVIITATATLADTPNNLMKALEEVEQQLELQGFYQRAKSIMANAAPVRNKFQTERGLIDAAGAQS